MHSILMAFQLTSFWKGENCLKSQGLKFPQEVIANPSHIYPAS